VTPFVLIITRPFSNDRAISVSLFAVAPFGRIYRHNEYIFDNALALAALVCTLAAIALQEFTPTTTRQRRSRALREFTPTATQCRSSPALALAAIALREFTPTATRQRRSRALREFTPTATQCRSSPALVVAAIALREFTPTATRQCQRPRWSRHIASLARSIDAGNYGTTCLE
jgi:hypothetical protein